MATHACGSSVVSPGSPGWGAGSREVLPPAVAPTNVCPERSPCHTSIPLSLPHGNTEIVISENISPPPQKNPMSLCYF